MLVHGWRCDCRRMRSAALLVPGLNSPRLRAVLASGATTLEVLPASRMARPAPAHSTVTRASTPVTAGAPLTRARRMVPGSFDAARRGLPPGDNPRPSAHRAVPSDHADMRRLRDVASGLAGVCAMTTGRRSNWLARSADDCEAAVRWQSYFADHRRSSLASQ